MLFLALGSAWFAVDLVRKLRQPAETSEPRRGESAAPLATAPAAPVAIPSPAAISPAPAPDTGIPAPHLVAITAAVHHLFKGRARLLSAFAAPSLSGTSSPNPPVDWAREGRRDIFTSHRVR